MMDQPIESQLSPSLSAFRRRVILFLTLGSVTFLWSSCTVVVMTHSEDITQNEHHRSALEELRQMREQRSGHQLRRTLKHYVHQERRVSIRRAESCPIDSIPIAWKVAGTHKPHHQKKRTGGTNKIASQWSCTGATAGSHVTIVQGNCAVDETVAKGIDDEESNISLACRGSVVACCPSSASGLSISFGGSDDEDSLSVEMDTSLFQKKTADDAAIPSSCSREDYLLSCKSASNPTSAINLEFLSPRPQGCSVQSDDEEVDEVLNPDSNSIASDGFTEYTVDFPNHHLESKEKKEDQVESMIHYRCIGRGNGDRGFVALPAVEGTLASDCRADELSNSIKCLLSSTRTSVQQQVTCPGGLGLSLFSTGGTTDNEASSIITRIGVTKGKIEPSAYSEYTETLESCHAVDDGLLECALVQNSVSGPLQLWPKCDVSFYTELLRDV